jgi:formylglycine-generating enzyme required for sulfatase activity
MKEQVNIDQLFQKAKTQPVARSFEKTKNEFLKHLSADVNTPPSDGKGSFFTLKNVIIMISSILTISIAAILLLPPEINNKPTKEAIEKIQPTEEVQEVEFVIEENEIPKTKEFIWPVLDPKSIESIQSFQPIELIVPKKEKAKSKKIVNPIAYSQYKYYPKLTAEEIEANHKQKKKMIKSLSKFDKKSYAYIPAGSFDYNGKTISIQALYMQVYEVTNLEYRTFLFDLLIQGKKDDFDIAKPEQEKWSTLTKQGKNEYEEYYFSHAAYDNYPVVNISREAAEMYCFWLSNETNATLKDDEKINDVRIPTRIEWVKAASNEGQYSDYPWGNGSAQNNEGQYLANYKIPAEEYAKLDPTSRVDLKGNPKDLTAPVKSYYPNTLGLYNLSGNVAEMVYEDYASKNNPGTAGGSWLNSEDEIKINGTDTYKGVTSGHPGIGFRIVVTHLNF